MPCIGRDGPKGYTYPKDSSGNLREGTEPWFGSVVN